MSATLVRPHQSWEHQFLALYNDYSNAGEQEWCEAAKDALTDFSSYISRLKAEALGIGISSDWSPTSHFWLMSDRRLIGTLRIRHHLTPAVEERAGHIGYDIAPTFRDQGYGHQILALALSETRKMGIREAIAICDESNTPSRRILEGAGGIITKTKCGEIWYLLGK